MEVTYLGPSALLGGTNVTSTSIVSGPSPMAASLDTEVSPANPGNGIDAEGMEAVPTHLINGAPPALAAPAPSAFVQDNPGVAVSHTGEPASLYQAGIDKAQGA